MKRVLYSHYSLILFSWRWKMKEKEKKKRFILSETFNSIHIKYLSHYLSKYIKQATFSGKSQFVNAVFLLI